MFDDPPAHLLIGEARNALENGLAPGFPQKVAANALGIAQRELEQGPALEEDSRARLTTLLGKEGVEADLTSDLCVAIGNGSIAAEDPALLAHLIASTIAKLEIDQPAYAAFRAWRDSR
ncbi:DUF6285 domain-containing protein [Tsuneonella mangrovi]|uniref:DUF6285 domain-containing protein n=1 Tax=Tsuneonella mangrovi TaxID=1982042 RepID=UPI000BA2901B|nr:DUF6285 domain-containing protein [Tsuneonella mangrovi]